MEVTLNPDAYELDPIAEHFRGHTCHMAELSRFCHWQIDRMIEAFKDKITWSKTKESSSGKMVWHFLAVRLGKDVWVKIEPCLGSKTEAAVTVHAHSPEIAWEWLARLKEQYKGKPKRTRKQWSFSVLVSGSRGFNDRAVDMRSHGLVESEQLRLHYGADFPQWADNLETALRKNSNGLCVLRGEPGTGKTYFLRHLIWRLRRTHRTFYIPSSYFNLLSTPELTLFWIEQQERDPRHKLLIILEDAESLLMSRGADNRGDVANLLNLADGLLGECIRVQLICTVNCPLERLDPAVTRCGRLIALREFRRLNWEEAEQLSSSLQIPLRDQRDYSLAEIYNQDQQLTAAPEAKRLGFAA